MARYTIDFSTNASAVVREIEKVNAAITKVAREGKSVSIKLDTSGLKSQLDTTFAQLNRQIEQMQSKLSRLQIGSQPFNKLASNIGFRQGQLERGQMLAQPLMLRGQAQSFDEGSAIRLQKELQAAQIQASQIRPASEPWVRLQGEIARINGELQRADRLAENIKLTNDLGAFAPGSLNRLEAQLTLLRNRAREISPDTAEWKALNKEIVKAEQGIAKQTKKPLGTGQRLGAAGGAFLYGGGLGGGIGSAAGGIAGGLLGGVPGAFTGAVIGQAVDTLGQYGAAIAATVAEVNKARIALAGVTRDAEDYDVALAAATSASNKFLLPISDATRQFARLQASIAGAGFQTDTTKKVFDGIAAAIVATGGKTEDLNGALTATAQVFSKGKVTAEELRGQIGERLPGAFTIFAQSIGKTPAQLDDALQKGEVSLSDFVKFTEELTKRYGAAAETLATAPENAGARLQVALQDASVRYAGFFQIVGAGFQDGITDVLNFVRENENGIKRVVTVFAVGFSTLGGIIGKFTSFLVNAFNKAFTYLLGSLDTVLARIEDAINRTQSAASLTPQQISRFQEQANKATTQRFGARIGGLNTGLIVDQQGASKFYNQYFDKLIDQATKSKGAKTYTQKLQETLFPEFRPSTFGSGLGAEGLPSAAADGSAGAGKKPKAIKRIPLEQLLDLESQRVLKLRALDRDLRLNELIRDAKIAGNEAEAESLTSLAGALTLRGKIAATQEFISLLINKEDEIIGKSLTKEEFNKKLQDANVELYELQNDLQKEYLDLQVKENDLQKRAQEELDEKLRKQQELNNLLQDAQISAGLIGPLEAARLQQQRGFAGELQRARELGASPEQLTQLQGLQAATPVAGSIAEAYKKVGDEIQLLTNDANLLSVAATGIGDAFGQTFTDVLSGAETWQQGLANIFKNIGSLFADLVAQILAKAVALQIIGLFVPGGTNSASNFELPSDAFVPSGGFRFANGGIAQGGFKAFADGGLVTGPTLGLVGEGRFNEAVVPLPNGKSIPVDLGNGAGNNISTNIVVNVSNGQASSQVTGGGGQALGRELEGAVRSVILREARPGGIIYNAR